MAGEITGSECKPASSVLLNGHVVKLFPKIFIYTYRPVLPPAVGREASFLQQMVINAETRNQGDESEWLSNAQF